MKEQQHMTKRMMITSALLATMLCGGVAFAAPGLVLEPEALSPTARQALQVQVMEARSLNPEVFLQTERLRDQIPAMDARKRGRLAPVGRMFRALGPQGLMPMLEQLALDAAPRGQQWTDSAWTALRCGMIEAVGSLRDLRSEPVLTSILTAGGAGHEVTRSATEALGKLGTDGAVTVLTGLASAPGPGQASVLQGLGYCRREGCVQVLVDVLAVTDDIVLAVTLIRSLGDAGNAWAWRFPAGKVAEEEAPVRSASAQAVMDAFVRFDGHVRQVAANMLMVIDHAGTPAMMTAARIGAEPGLQADLEAFEARFARNPARR
jgi:hypothetical protein